ncbi:ferrochelatase [Janibacter melonis]|uniref:ferrochelatase n=1 Tax=Janibacter melonis TaxID=262209 RepID=UPI001E43BBCA|nr:ferrochelatase [Janibacter melonis]MCB5990356.1 ferrochelatase [Janibacter melonis]
MPHDAIAPYDAIILHSFGGPEGPDEVLPFLRRVTGGKGIPDERLREVGAHYDLFGGRSPINDHGRRLVAELTEELRRREIDVPVRLGNRHSPPFTADVLAELADEGARHVLAIRTSAWQSYSSCRSYREDLAAALADVRVDGLDVDLEFVRPYGQHPGFAQTNAELVTAALREVLEDDEAPALLFVTHSIPETMDITSGPGDAEERAYSRGHADLGAAICDHASEQLGQEITGELTFCSRSGPPSMPWLEPDVGDRIEELAAEGVRTVVVVPIGFVSDHMEVIYDLDTEAAATAKEHGVRLVRVPTVGTHPAFVEGLADLAQERAAMRRGEDVEPRAWAGLVPAATPCRPGCCPNLREALPAVGEHA